MEKNKKFMRMFMEREVRNMFELTGSIGKIHGKDIGDVLTAECINNVLENKLMEPKTLVERIGIDPELVYAVMIQRAGLFSEDKFEPGLKRFKEHSNLIFKDEHYFESDYVNTPSGILQLEYRYKPASKGYLHLFYQLYKHLSGKSYESAEQLRDQFASSIKDKKILELGCGPGFALRVLKDFGADVAGIEVNDKYKDKTQDLNIKYKDAQNLQGLFSEEQFDIVCSRDFFCEPILIHPKAWLIAHASYFLTKENGLGIHQITHERIPKKIYDFGLWAMHKARGKESEFAEIKKIYDGWSKEERARLKWTNLPILKKQEYELMGFEVLDYRAGSGDFNVVVKKKPLFD